MRDPQKLHDGQKMKLHSQKQHKNNSARLVRCAQYGHQHQALSPKSLRLTGIWAPAAIVETGLQVRLQMKCICPPHCQKRFHAAGFLSLGSNSKSYLGGSDRAWLLCMGPMQVSGLYSGTLLTRKDFPNYMKSEDIGRKHQRCRRYQRSENIIMDSSGVSVRWRLRNGVYHLFQLHDLDLPASTLTHFNSSHRPHWSQWSLQQAELLQLRDFWPGASLCLGLSTSKSIHG